MLKNVLYMQKLLQTFSTQLLMKMAPLSLKRFCYYTFRRYHHIIYKVEKLTAQILNGAMSDAILDIVFDLTDEKDKINVSLSVIKISRFIIMTLIKLDVFLEVIEAVLSRTCNWGSLETSTHGMVNLFGIVLLC